MKQQITFSDFTDQFHRHERQDQFSYAGLEALYGHFIQYEEDAGEEMELDVIAICCEFTEYEGIEELKREYPDIKDLEDLEGHTQVIKVGEDGRFIIQLF